jgi:hypothetical protein
VAACVSVYVRGRGVRHEHAREYLLRGRTRLFSPLLCSWSWSAVAQQAASPSMTLIGPGREPEREVPRVVLLRARRPGGRSTGDDMFQRAFARPPAHD